MLVTLWIIDIRLFILCYFLIHGLCLLFCLLSNLLFWFSVSLDLLIKVYFYILQIYLFSILFSCFYLSSKIVIRPLWFSKYLFFVFHVMKCFFQVQLQIEVKVSQILLYGEIVKTWVNSWQNCFILCNKQKISIWNW